jgi:NADPH:quinone reductase
LSFRYTQGAYAEYVTTDEALALPLPESLDWINGAALPEALFTTWFNFVELMRIAPGETALIHGGASGVGTTAIQLLRALGHEVFATGGTTPKREAARALGCSAVFDYAAPDLAKQILSATGGRGIDTILDTSAGAHLADDLVALAPGGRISHLSAGGGRNLDLPLRALMASPRLHHRRLSSRDTATPQAADGRSAQGTYMADARPRDQTSNRSRAFALAGIRRARKWRHRTT